jgi:hypothetical protein
MSSREVEDSDPTGGVAMSKPTPQEVKQKNLSPIIVRKDWKGKSTCSTQFAKKKLDSNFFTCGSHPLLTVGGKSPSFLLRQLTIDCNHCDQ